MAVQWLRPSASNAVMQGTEFQFLVRELRSHMLHDTAKKKKKRKKITNLENNLENNKYTESL